MSAKPVLGLYFTDHFIEISQVSAEGTRLVRFNRLPLPPGLVVNGEVKGPAGLIGVLLQLLATARPRPIRSGEDVVIGVEDNRVFLREFSLPKYAGKEIEGAIKWQVRSILPVLPPGVETDWQIIGRSAEDEIEVLLAAIQKNVIESYVAVAVAAGLQVVAVEPAVFANIRVIKPELLRGKNQLLVYIGDNFAEFTYMTNGNPRFSDFLPEAEVRKKGTIVDIIRDYVSFSNSKHLTRPVSEIIISGFGPQVESIVATLSALNVAVFLAVSRLTAADIENHNLLYTSHGLSLKTLDPPSFNLLSLDFRLDVIRRHLVATWKAVLSGLVVLTLLGSLGLYYLYQAAQVRQVGLINLKEQYQQELAQPQNQDLIKQAGQLNRLTDQLMLLRDTTGGESGLLRQIAAVAPEGLSLSSLVYSRGPGSQKLADPKGVWAITGTASSRTLVLDFYNRLLAQPDFINGRLYFGSLEKETAISFRIASQKEQ